MSYILYINDQLIQLSDAKPLAQTKQVNDLAKFASRQTNYTNKFIAPPTANNVRALDRVGLVGSQSNLPYEKVEVNLFDSDTGECLIYKGWGNITGTSEKGYEIYVYDGNIDFYKALENLTLTDVGISDLNHIKNLVNVIASFTTNLNYSYIIADYNGNNATHTNAFNIDFQLPSAKKSYLWDRIFQYTGFTYSGSVFESEKFLNNWMTYPKPVPTLEPIVNGITSQTSIIQETTSSQPTEFGGMEYVTSYAYVIFPSNFDNAYANNNNVSYITVKQDGVFRLKATGYFQYSNGVKNHILNWTVSNASGIKSSGSVDTSIKTENINVLAGDRLLINSLIYGYVGGGIYNPIFGSMTTTLEYLVGYDANFEEALLDFKVKDFVNEIMQEFGLTMFKDKYTKNVDFKTLKEILDSDVIEDWSDKFESKVSEKYIFSNYAQKNNFKYRYNDENAKHNDGFISVSNKNLADEITIVNSKIYTPEKDKKFVVGLKLNTYKFWNKEIKDDSTIEYKELTGRYYFLRRKEHTFGSPIAIGSESLNTETTISVVKIEDYSRLKYQEIIYDSYSEIESVLDKSKTLEVNFNLKTRDVANFTFKNLIYVDKLASYYLVNKIPNFIKGKITKCEIIEVDYRKTLMIPTDNTGTYTTISNIEIVGCDVTIHFDTDAEFPVNVRVVGQPNSFGFIPPPVFGPERYFDQVIVATSNIVTITVLSGGFWDFYTILTEANIQSNHFYFQNTSTCAFIPPPPDLTFITITHVQTISLDVEGNIKTVKIDFDTDLVLPSDIYLKARYDGVNRLPDYHTISSKSITETFMIKAYMGANFDWFIKLGHGGVESPEVNISTNF